MLEVVVGRVGDGKSLYMANKVSKNPKERFMYIPSCSEYMEFFKKVRVLQSVNKDLTKQVRLPRRDKKALVLAYGPKSYGVWKERNKIILNGSAVESVHSVSTISQLTLGEGYDHLYVDGIDLIVGDKRETIQEIYELSKHIDTTITIQANKSMYDNRLEGLAESDVIDTLRINGIPGREDVKIVTLYRRGDDMYSHNRTTADEKFVSLELFGKTYKETFETIPE